jgi:predicted metal-dependent phosphoesterase TrpH
MPTLKLDLHVHTVRSYDGHTRQEDLPQIIASRGLDGVAVTEHDRFDPPRLSGTLILPAVEISSKDGHVIGLGIREVIEPRLAADETIRRIHDQGAVAIIPHPYDPVCECVKIARLKEKPDAVETVNADALSFYISNWLARKDAQKFKLPEVGGSDSHIPQTIGDAYTVVDTPSNDLDAIIESIRSGKVRAEGHATSALNKMRKLSYKFK